MLRCTCTAFSSIQVLAGRSSGFDRHEALHFAIRGGHISVFLELLQWRFFDDCFPMGVCDQCMYAALGSGDIDMFDCVAAQANGRFQPNEWLQSKFRVLPEMFDNQHDDAKLLAFMQRVLGQWWPNEQPPPLERTTRWLRTILYQRPHLMRAISGMWPESYFVEGKRHAHDELVLASLEFGRPRNWQELELISQGKIKLADFDGTRFYGLLNAAIASGSAETIKFVQELFPRSCSPEGFKILNGISRCRNVEVSKQYLDTISLSGLLQVVNLAGACGNIPLLDYISSMDHKSVEELLSGTFRAPLSTEHVATPRQIYRWLINLRKEPKKLPLDGTMVDKYAAELTRRGEFEELEAMGCSLRVDRIESLIGDFVSGRLLKMAFQRGCSPVLTVTRILSNQKSDKLQRFLAARWAFRRFRHENEVAQEMALALLMKFDWNVDEASHNAAILEFIQAVPIGWLKFHQGVWLNWKSAPAIIEFSASELMFDHGSLQTAVKLSEKTFGALLATKQQVILANARIAVVEFFALKCGKYVEQRRIKGDKPSKRAAIFGLDAAERRRLCGWMKLADKHGALPLSGDNKLLYHRLLDATASVGSFAANGKYEPERPTFADEFNSSQMISSLVRHRLRI